ncbi:class I SAM-dependent methyltransferase [Pelagibacteraceae bacterium]|nr:class I SAM-dependent methyltransferase [Pelagibacteraceae bacterium]
MIEFLLKYPLLYRIYQTFVRKNLDEYDFLKHVFKLTAKQKKINVLDLCCADSFILNYIDEYIEDYIGVDFNEHCIKKNLSIWKKYNFKKLDLTNDFTFKELIKFKPNLILVHGAFHHLNDDTVKQIIYFIKAYFPDCIFISVDPVVYKNKILNKLMIKLDRGKFIRSKITFEELINGYDSMITDDFYKMSFKYIFFYKNINLLNIYREWKEKK